MSESDALEMKLESCPFCGDSADLKAWGAYYSALCSNCNAQTASFKEQSDAVDAWNTRLSPPPPAVGGEAEALAQQFHETYERLAPSFGYETRKESAKPWSDVPDQNKRLMIAVCAEILAALTPQGGQ